MSAAREELSYHDVTVIVDGKRYRITDNYAYELTCTRVAGWRLWNTWGDKSQLIGGEFDGGEFRIEVAGRAICDRAADPTPKEESQE